MCTKSTQGTKWTDITNDIAINYGCVLNPIIHPTKVLHSNTALYNVKGTKTTRGDIIRVPSFFSKCYIKGCGVLKLALMEKRKELAKMPKLCDCGGRMGKNEKWHIFYSYRNPSTGKMKRFKVAQGFAKLKTKREGCALADRLIKQYSEKLRSGWNPFMEKEDTLYEDQLTRVDELRFVEAKAEKETFTYFSSYFLKEKAKTARRNSVITYRSKLRKFREWLTASNIHDNVKNLRPDVIQDFFSYIIDVKHLSKESVKNYKQLLTIVLDLAVEDNVIEDNPVSPTIHGGLDKDMGAYPMTPEDFKLIIDSYENEPQHRLAAFFQYYCMLRPGKEIRLMRVRMISFGTGTITIPAEISKSGRQKIVTIPTPLLQELRRLGIHRADANFFVLGKGDEKTPGPQAWGKNYFSMKFARTRDKLNLPKQYKHYSCKHTGARDAEAAGIPHSAIMRQCGHRNLEITTRYLNKSCKVGDDNFKTKMRDITH